MAACCAFAVTYAVTINYPELLNNNDKIVIENEYITDDLKYEDSLEEHDDSTYEKNNEISVYEHNSNHEKEKVYREEKSEVTVDKGQAIDNGEHTSGNKNVVINSEVMNTEEIKDNNIAAIDNSQNQNETDTNNNNISDKNNYIVQNYSESNYVENDNSNISVASYGNEVSKQREYLSERGVPDLSKSGLYINYVNQISQNEVEIMYSDDSRNLWVKICSEEDEDLKDSSKSVYYLEEDEQEKSKDDYEKNDYIVYRKNNKNYYILSDISIDDKFINDIIKYI